MEVVNREAIDVEYVEIRRGRKILENFRTRDIVGDGFCGYRSVALWVFDDKENIRSLIQ